MPRSKKPTETRTYQRDEKIIAELRPFIGKEVRITYDTNTTYSTGARSLARMDGTEAEIWTETLRGVLLGVAGRAAGWSGITYDLILKTTGGTGMRSVSLSKFIKVEEV